MPLSLHITASDISRGQNWCCVFKTVQYRLCICIFLRLIYFTRTKLGLCIQKGGISPLSLHIAASDISQGKNWCCVFKTVL